MLKQKSAPGIDFFNQVSGLFSSIGRGWYPQNPKDSVAAFQSVGSDAGKVITVPGALQLAAVWACVRLIAETIGSLPLSVYNIDSTGKKTLATDHPLFDLLRNTPNADMTAVEFWEMMAASICFWGNAYAVKNYIGKRLISLDPLRPEFVNIYRTAAGDIRYTFRRGEQVADYASDEIYHIKGFGVDGLVGLSPISMARQTIGRALSTDEASGKVFQSGLSASGFIKYANSFVTADQREQVRQQIQNFTGSSNYGKVMVLENGMDYMPITINPQDAQMLQTRSFNVEEICRWFGVPPQLVGHVDKASSWASSLENTTLGFLKFSLRPYLTRIEQSVRRSLFAPGDRNNFRTSFNLDALLRGDSAQRAALYASAGQNGWMSRNEIRSLEFLPPDKSGDALTVQSNLIPLDKVGTLGGQQGTSNNTPPAGP